MLIKVKRFKFAPKNTSVRDGFEVSREHKSTYHAKIPGLT